MVNNMYNLKSLPFSFSALEPFIDTHTVALHYYKHQASYLNSLNKILEKYKFNYEIEMLYNKLDLIKNEDLNDVIFYLGGVLNHDIYWESINPSDKESPKGMLLDAINEKYGSIDNFFNEFQKLSLNIKGAGYVFLVKTQDKKVDLITTSNQDNPTLFGLTPLLTIDLWEHAYYLNYNNDKQKYFDNYKQIVNFRYANNVFNK